MSAEVLPVPEAPRLGTMPRWALPVIWALSTLALLPLFFAARWAGNEVGSFQMTTFESAARQALAKKDYSGALKYCNGAIKAAHNHSEHWGRVYTLRALAFAGQGDLHTASKEIVRAGDFFARRYYYAEDQDRREVPQLANALATRLMQANEHERALEVFSAGAMASGKPVDALYDLVAALSPAQKLQLWGTNQPYLYVNAFIDPKEGLPSVVLNEQGRTQLGSDQQAGDGGPDTATVRLDASKQDGTCWVGIPLNVAIAQRQFGVRLRVKQEQVIPLKLLLSYWFESPQKSAMTEDAPVYDDAKGWTTFEVARPFFAERVAEGQKNGYSPEDGVINKVGISLPPGPKNSLRFAPVELYLPKG